MDTLIQRLIACRKAMGLTQAELASRMNVSQTIVARIEKERHSPTLETLRKMTDAMGLALSIAPKTRKGM